MQEPWTIVGVVLLAVLVGAALPVLFQLYSTLSFARRLLDRLGPRVDSTLADISDASRGLNRVGHELEQNTKRAQALFDAMGDIGESVGRLRDSLKTASTVSAALGPAIAAAIGVLTEIGSKKPEGERGAQPDEPVADESEDISRSP
jgi:uncharacterized protein YoxC